MDEANTSRLRRLLGSEVRCAADRAIVLGELAWIRSCVSEEVLENYETGDENNNKHGGKSRPSRSPEQRRSFQEVQLAPKVLTDDERPRGGEADDASGD